MTRMPLPEWFPANHVFNRGGAWYVGSPAGMHLGPYPDRTVAESCGMHVATMLISRRSVGAQLALLRELMRGESAANSGTPRARPADGVRTDGEPGRPAGSAPVPLRVRAGEETRTWFRSSQVFRENESWFIATRERIEVGPYRSERAARDAARRLVALLADAGDDSDPRSLILGFRDPAPD